MSRTTAVRESSWTAPSFAALRTVHGGVAATSVTLAVFAAILAQTTDILDRLLPPAAIAVVVAFITVAGASIYIRAWLREVRRPRGTTMSVFVGAEPFTEDEQDRFFGRKAETDEIVRKLRNGDVRFIVLFGQSGCGKTSLIQAGVMPALRSDGIKCVYTRPTASPSSR